MKTILRKKHMSFISLLLTFTILFLGASRSFAANDSNVGVVESYFYQSGDGYEIIKDSLGTLYYFFIEDNIRGVLTCFENGEIKLTYSDTPYEEDIVSVKNFQIDEEDIERNLLDKKIYMVSQGFPKDEECNREIMTQTKRNIKAALYRGQSYYTRELKALTNINNFRSLNIDNFIEDIEHNLLDEKHYDVGESISSRNVTNSEANQSMKDYMARQGFPKDEEYNREIISKTERNIKTAVYRSQSYYTRKVKALDVVPGMPVSTIVTILGFSFSGALGAISTIMSADELVSSVHDVLNVYLTDFEGLKEVYRSNITRRTMWTEWSGQAKGIIADSRKESFELNYSRKDYDYDGGDLHLLSSAKFRY
jgi:hypothetical protein